MKTNLILVESPFQALCALEVSLRNKNDKNILVYKLSESPERKVNNSQIENTISYGDWTEIIEFKANNKYGGLSVHYSTAVFLRNLASRYSDKIDKLFFGEFRSRWMHQARLAINASEDWLIDDGAATIKAVNESISKGVYVDSNVLVKSSAIKSVVFQLIYGKYERKLSELKKQPVNVFSAFVSETNGDLGLEKNNFSYIKSFFNSKDNGKSNKVFYYGSKYSEAGVVSQEYELAFLNKIQCYYSQKGLEVQYFTHRDESSAKLELVEKIFSNSVIKNTDMAEMHLLKSGVKPVEIAAAYSSVLSSLNVIFPEIKKTSFRLKEAEIQEKFSKGISMAYEFYESEGVELVVLD